ncbi:hypothetical protein [uncultured Mucilaginibacter sp.]|uniref:hypothetical protein n=1 Tax=uncultured Mucilaginibacter sp. TaxID=797541 RepID=UPI0025F6B66B|nr:hypothetical protein [uncultured Mucilaginibacter sp.]
MKFWLLSFFLTVLGINYTYAQEVNLKEWVSHKIDSLQNSHIDTIEYYHQYCAGCFIRKTSTTKKHNICEADGYTQIENIIIYQQRGKFYSLAFNCNYPLVERRLSEIKSFAYFLSIVPILNKRDSIITATENAYKNRSIVMNDTNKFLFGGGDDGIFEEAYLVVKELKQSVKMELDQKTDKVWRSYFWIDKQTKLLTMLESETASKD